MSTHELSALLWTERGLLETLLFQLDQERLLLITGNSRWLGRSANEIDRVRREIQAVGLARSVESSIVAAEWGAPAEPTLRELIEHAPAPWDEILTAHLAALTQITGEIRTLRDENAALLRGASRAAQEALADISASPSLYTAAGSTTAAPAGGQLLNAEA